MALNIFIADLHLSSDRPDTIDLLMHFLQSYPSGGDNLYVLGDLFDAWVGDDDDAPLADQIRCAFQALMSRGVSLYLQRGNRDFLLGKRFMHQTGAKLLPDCYRVMIAGQPTLLMHGDLLCTDDVAYQKARRTLRNPLFQWLMLRKSLVSRRKMAATYRQLSREKTGSTAADIMDANAQTVMRYLQKYRVTQLIHGHTHRPMVHHITLPGGQPAKRYVLGEWYADRACALIDNGEIIFEENICSPSLLKKVCI